MTACSKAFSDPSHALIFAHVHHNALEAAPLTSTLPSQCHTLPLDIPQRQSPFVKCAPNSISLKRQANLVRFVGGKRWLLENRRRREPVRAGQLQQEAEHLRMPRPRYGSLCGDSLPTPSPTTTASAHGASRRRTAQDDGRRQSDPRPLSRQRARADRPDGGTDRGAVSLAGLVDRICEDRQVCALAVTGATRSATRCLTCRRWPRRSRLCRPPRSMGSARPAIPRPRLLRF